MVENSSNFLLIVVEDSTIRQLDQKFPRSACSFVRGTTNKKKDVIDVLAVSQRIGIHEKLFACWILYKERRKEIRGDARGFRCISSTAGLSS